MLHEFISRFRFDLIRRCQEKEAKRLEPSGVLSAPNHGVPLFLDQVVTALKGDELPFAHPAPEPLPAPAPTDIGRAAALHGAEMLRGGFRIDQVVHCYGDVCQSITDMAVETRFAIEADEFRTLNRCLDDAIADAVTAFGKSRQKLLNEQAESLRERLNSFTDEQRRLIDTAIQAYAAIKTGSIGPTGATGTLLIHSLEELRALADRTIPDIRLASANCTLSQQ